MEAFKVGAVLQRLNSAGQAVSRDSIMLTMNVFSNQPNNFESMWMIPVEPVEHAAYVLEILSLEQSTDRIKVS